MYAEIHIMETAYQNVANSGQQGKNSFIANIGRSMAYAICKCAIVGWFS
jgi:hypothetical protein